MTEPVSISIHFVNKLPDHIEAQRFLYRQGIMAKLDKVVAVLLFIFGVYCLISVGFRWWSAIGISGYPDAGE
jgi:hypothetical protein